MTDWMPIDMIKTDVQILGRVRKLDGTEVRAYWVRRPHPIFTDGACAWFCKDGDVLGWLDVSHVQVESVLPLGSGCYGVPTVAELAAHDGKFLIEI